MLLEVITGTGSVWLDTSFTLFDALGLAVMQLSCDRMIRQASRRAALILEANDGLGG